MPKKPKSALSVCLLFAPVCFISTYFTFSKVDQTIEKTRKRYTRILKTLYPNFENLTSDFFCLRYMAYTLEFSQKGLLLNISLPWNSSFSSLNRLKTLYPKNVISESDFGFCYFRYMLYQYVFKKAL